MKALDDGGVFFRDAIAERLGAVGGGNAGRVEEIFSAPGNAVKRATVLSGSDFFVGFFGLGEREIARESNDASELGIELLYAVQVDLREALGSEFVLLDPAGKLRDRGEGDIRIVGRQRAGLALGADKVIAPGAPRLARENGMVAREWCERGFERDRARTGAALVKGGKVYAPGFCGARAVGGR